LGLALLCAPVATSAAGTGGEAGSYLLLPVGAAATALGGAGTAAPDYYGSWWNPAMAATLQDDRIAAGTAIRTLGRVDAYGSFDFRVPPRVGVGLFMLYRGDPSLNDLHDYDESLLPAASYTTLTFMGSVSYYATRRLSLGACFNVFYQSLPTYNENFGLGYTSATSTGSFDFAAQYRLIPGIWTLAAVFKNIGTKLDWVDVDPYSGEIGDDQYQPNLVIGSSLVTSLGQRPLIWNLDCRVSIYGDSTQNSDQGEAAVSTGAEWREWDNFYIRAGIGEITVNSDLFNNRTLYANEFSPRYSLGFAYNLKKYLHRSTWFNYAASTDRIWDGLDQQFDIAMSF
jgi:hypothetical protein